MAEHDDWTAADDARVRAALTSLRADVESAPLPDVRFVKARGMARRRRRFLTVGAAAAVAAVVAGTVGYGVLDEDAEVVNLPAARSSTTQTTTAAPAPTSRSSLDQPGALPLLQEWKASLDLKGAARLTPVEPFEAVECLDAEPGAKVQQDGITLDAGGPSGGQVRFALTSGTDPEKAASAVANDLSDCKPAPGFRVTAPDDTDAGRFYSYTAGDAGSGWLMVIQGLHDVALLQITDPTPATSQFTLAQVTALGEIAHERLARYGTTASPATPSSTNAPEASNQKMVVTGPDPLPSSNLFVAASQWASPELTSGAKTSDGPGALEGSTAVASCETDDQQAAIGGSVGVVSVRTGTGAAGYVGRQRVQADEAVEPAVQKAYVSARLAEARALYAKGCEGANYTVKSVAGPTKGTFRLDTVFKDGTPTLSEWVGVTAQKTGGAVSTVVITKASDPDQAFAELDRLLALARQK